jgi:hypothetical protein
MRILPEESDIEKAVTCKSARKNDQSPVDDNTTAHGTSVPWAVSGAFAVGEKCRQINAVRQ